MRKQMFLGESIRSENGTTGLPIFGKYTAIVRSVEVRTFLADDADGGDDWMWVSVNGCTGGTYTTEQEAMSRGIAWTEQRGFIHDREQADKDAIQAAKQRHDDHCDRSSQYNKYYA